MIIFLLRRESFFNKIQEPLIKKVIDDHKEIRNLVKIRDALLPKLMSGQIPFEIVKVDGEFTTGKRENIVLIARERLELHQKVAYKKLDERIY